MKMDKKIENISRSWLNRRLKYAEKRKTGKQSQYKGIMKVYLELMNKCFMPDCNYGYDLEVHHIHPLNKGGTDTFDNLIILCKVCHRQRKLHSNWQSKQVELLTLKFYKELEVLGFTSDCSDEEFLKKISECKANNLKETRELKGGKEKNGCNWY